MNYYRRKRVKNRCLFLFSICLIAMLITPGTVKAGSGFTVTPSSLDINLEEGGSAETQVFITSDFDGELIVGTEDIPLIIEPEVIQVSSTDDSREVTLLLSAGGVPDKGSYSGKITFLARSNTNVFYGVKIKASLFIISEGSEAEQPAQAERKNYTGIIIGSVCLACLVSGTVFFWYKHQNNA